VVHGRLQNGHPHQESRRGTVPENQSAEGVQTRSPRALSLSRIQLKKTERQETVKENGRHRGKVLLIRPFFISKTALSDKKTP